MSKPKVISKFVVSGVVACAVTGWWWRPIPDPAAEEETKHILRYSNPHLTFRFV